MTLTRRDAAATALTILVVLTYTATHEGWGVPLVGGSHRWAAAAIGLLGIVTCALGSPGRDAPARGPAALGILALALFVLALVTGSLTPLSLLVVADVVLWAVSTLHHSRHAPARPIPA